MNPTDLAKVQKLYPLSKDTIKRSLDGLTAEVSDMIALKKVCVAAPTERRIRQSQKPILNKLEAEWFAIVSAQFPNFPRPRAQARRYELGRGIWFKPDVTASIWPQPDGPAIETAWECKGPHAFRGGFENLKVAARVWPEVRWILVWKEDGRWVQQTILP